MKKILTFMLMMIGMVLMSTLTTSCRDHRHYNPSSSKDSVFIASIVNNVNHSEFTSQDEFMLYLVDKRDQAHADSIVFHLHDAVINGICNKILTSGGKLSIRSVCDEYLSNKTFYDGMNRSLERPYIEDHISAQLVDSTKEGGTN